MGSGLGHELGLLVLLTTQGIFNQYLSKHYVKGVNMEEKDIIPENPYYRRQDFGDGNQVEWNEQPEFSCFDEGAQAQLKKVVEWLADGRGEWCDVPEAGGECFCIYESFWQELLKIAGVK